MPITGYRGLRGFTLIELLLAMGISVFVAAVAYQGLSVAIDASGAVERQTRRLADIQLAMDILQEDIRHIINRPVRNELGVMEPSLAGGSDPAALILFTRTGWDNPRQSLRSDLARINYALRDRGLWRQRWLVLDRATLEGGLQEVELLQGIESIQVSFLNPLSDDALENPLPADPEMSSGWVPAWRSGQLAPGISEPLPAAVRISLVLDDFGEVSRVFAITGA